MPTPKKFVVWTWMSENGNPRFVGWGPYVDQHPAKRLWAMRGGRTSDLNRWLCRFLVEPTRLDHAGAVRYYRTEASTVAQALRNKYRGEGHKLLDPRPWGTKSGGGAPRWVIGPDLKTYESVRQAAVDVGVSACTITRLCQSEGTGWDYL